MKLVTNIKPRRDGTVIVRGAGGVAHVFAPDEAGDLVCDIEDQATLAKLLAQNDGNDFSPADPSDFDAAEQLLPKDEDEGAGEGDEDGLEGLGEDDEAPNGGLPVEANTPPAEGKAPKPKKAARA